MRHASGSVPTLSHKAAASYASAVTSNFIVLRQAKGNSITAGPAVGINKNRCSFCFNSFAASSTLWLVTSATYAFIREKEAIMNSIATEVHFTQILGQSWITPSRQLRKIMKINRCACTYSIFRQEPQSPLQWPNWNFVLLWGPVTYREGQAKGEMTVCPRSTSFKWS